MPNQQNHAPCWSSILHNNSCSVKNHQQWSLTVIDSIQVQHSTISDISTERHRLGSFGLIRPGGPSPSAPLDPNASSCDAMRCTCGASSGSTARTDVQLCQTISALEFHHTESSSLSPVFSSLGNTRPMSTIHYQWSLNCFFFFNFEIFHMDPSRPGSSQRGTTQPNSAGE
jgi:hypothetical protein